MKHRYVAGGKKSMTKPQISLLKFTQDAARPRPLHERLVQTIDFKEKRTAPCGIRLHIWRSIDIHLKKRHVKRHTTQRVQLIDCRQLANIAALAPLWLFRRPRVVRSHRIPFQQTFARKASVNKTPKC